MNVLRNGLNWILQTGYSTVLLFSRNQLFSHASAAAYYFLLAIGPLILVLVSVLNTSLSSYPELTAELFELMARFNPQLNEDFFRRIGVLQAQPAVGGLGLLVFLWISRLIIGSVQSAFSIIFPSSRSRNFFWSNLLSMVLVPMVLTLLLLSAVFNLAIRFLHSQVEHSPWLEKLYELLLSLTGLTLPLVLVFGLIFICYRYLPLARPRIWHAVLGAALCTLAIFGLNAAFVKYVNLASYHIVYGSLGAVILLLFWVFLVFLVFFLFAQFVQVAGRIDVIALDKIIAPRASAAGFGRWLEQNLFRSSGRIYSRYARRVRDKETIFSQGDQGTDIYYVLQGRVEILSGPPGASGSAAVAVIERGQMFGEMAYLLGEKRIYSARALGDGELLLITPGMFEDLLEQSPAVARKIINSMGRRLKQVAAPSEG